ncbi:MAG: hemerythrin domain-containing protein [Acidobacteriota bacterium]
MKRIPGLRPLSDDHHSALVMARQCRLAEPDTAAATWRHVRSARDDHFERHFLLEEEHLVPALEALGEAEHATRIRDDHERLRELLSREELELGELHEFGELLKQHVRYEEREVFAATQERLPDDVLSALVSAAEASPRSRPRMDEGSP